MTSRVARSPLVDSVRRDHRQAQGHYARLGTFVRAEPVTRSNVQLVALHPLLGLNLAPPVTLEVSLLLVLSLACPATPAISLLLLVLHLAPPATRAVTLLLLGPRPAPRARPPLADFAQRDRRLPQAQPVPPDISVRVAPTTSANAGQPPAAIVLPNRPLLTDHCVLPAISVSAALMARSPVEPGHSRQPLVRHH